MANTKITQLDDADLPLTGEELIEIVQGGVNKKAPQSAVSGGSGSTPTLAEVLEEGATNNQIALELDSDESESIIFYSNGNVVGSIVNTSGGIDIAITDTLGENATAYKNGSIDVQKDSGTPINLLLPYTDETTGNTIATREWVNANVSGGAVDSVNGQTGVVVLDAGDVGAEPTITATTSADYYRGDKTFQPLNKSAVGLGNVDNTSDANKPVSTAQQTEFNQRGKTILNCNTAPTAVNLATGTGVVLYQITIPANTVSDLDSVEIESLTEKTNTNGTWSQRFYTDTASTFNVGTALLLATSPSMASGNLYGSLKREFIVRGTTLKALGSAVTSFTDENTAALSANTFTTTTWNPAVDNTLYLVGIGNASDLAQKQNFKITIFKNKTTI
jgi:hypothetical protein